MKLFRHPGALFSFELVDDVDEFAFLNRLDVVIKSSNLGDNRTLAIPVAETIYYEMGPERRASMGIRDSLIRIFHRHRGYRGSACGLRPGSRSRELTPSRKARRFASLGAQGVR